MPINKQFNQSNNNEININQNNNNNKKLLFYQIYFYIINILNKRIPNINNILDNNDYTNFVSLCIDNNSLEILLKPTPINDFFNNIILNSNFINDFNNWFSKLFDNQNNNINTNINNNQNEIIYKNSDPFSQEGKAFFSRRLMPPSPLSTIEINNNQNNLQQNNYNNQNINNNLQTNNYNNQNINNNLQTNNYNNQNINNNQNNKKVSFDENVKYNNIEIDYNNKMNLQINNKDTLLINKTVKSIQLFDFNFTDNNYNVNINNKLILNNKTYIIPEGYYSLDKLMNWLKNNILEYEFIINNNKLTIISKNNDIFTINNDEQTSILYLFGFINPIYENQIDYTGENNININKHYIIHMIINDEIFNIFNIENLPAIVNKIFENPITIKTLQIILKQNDYQDSNVKDISFKLLIK